MKVSRRSVAFAAAIGGLLLGGVAVASALHDGDTIHGCVKSNGQLRIVDQPSDCGSNETNLDWSQTGPAGPAGPPGPGGGDDSVGEMTFGVATAGCSAGEYELIVESSTGIIPAFASGGCSAPVATSGDLHHAGAFWIGSQHVDADDVGDLVDLRWEPSQIFAGVWTDVGGSAWRLSCGVNQQSSTLAFVDGVPGPPEFHPLQVACNLEVRARPSYPIVAPAPGPATLIAALDGALSSGQLISEPLVFYRHRLTRRSSPS